jgi:hypothetical protein
MRLFIALTCLASPVFAGLLTQANFEASYNPDSIMPCTSVSDTGTGYASIATPPGVCTDAPWWIPDPPTAGGTIWAIADYGYLATGGDYYSELSPGFSAMAQFDADYTLSHDTSHGVVIMDWIFATDSDRPASEVLNVNGTSVTFPGHGDNFRMVFPVSDMSMPFHVSAGLVDSGVGGTASMDYFTSATLRSIVATPEPGTGLVILGFIGMAVGSTLCSISRRHGARTNHYRGGREGRYLII